MPPPLLGQHNVEVLKNWLGMSDQAIDELKREKVL
jgi:crotonobetainyl-CoA:carnitine CoA-transferase CaiB-like acyl-CoA transferase